MEIGVIVWGVQRHRQSCELLEWSLALNYQLKYPASDD